MDKFKRCGRCGEKKMLSNHDRAKYNSTHCPDCTVELLYEKILKKD